MTPEQKKRAKELVERISVELALPSSTQRLAWNAEDPLAPAHNYLINMRVLVPLAFGIRLCFRCPHCSIDPYDGAAAYLYGTTTIDTERTACQNLCGNNGKMMGGYAGIGQGMGFATEHQGEGTPRGHDSV